jgi:hypothetical protein
VRPSYDAFVITSTTFGKMPVVEFTDSMVKVAGLESIIGSG